MPAEYIRTYGPNPFITELAARPNRQLALVEFEVVNDQRPGTLLFYLDVAAAATHAEQVNGALREVDGGELMVVEMCDEYRTVDGDGHKVGYVVPDRGVAERSAVAGGLRPQVRTVVKHAWRDLPAAVAA